MLKFLRIICIWICCAFCLLERIQLPAATAAIAAPFEYFEDHDQLSYDLDTEQSKAKYDTRLLSEQMLKLEKSTERYESADRNANGIGNSATNSELEEDTESEADADVDDLQPHERAASCHNNGHKYTHGQKVPRIDPCEVCLCMDGEIFCWWELCSKKPASQIPAEYQTNPQYDTSTVRLNARSSTAGTTVQPIVNTVKLQQQYPDPRPYGSTFDVSAPKPESSKSKQQQQTQDTTITSSTATGGTKPYVHATKSWQKKKTYQQQQKQKYEQQKQHQHKHAHEHAAYYAYPPSSSVSASKILSFPENLPSVLYHDYRTEEHQHHQHQHHQQHLKHQQKKLQLLMQQQQQKRKQQMLQHTHGPRKDGEHQPSQYQHDIFAGKSAASAYASSPSLYTGRDSSNLELSADWGLVGGNENIYDDAEADSDILPEPPTKKPKMTAAAAAATAEAPTSAVELVTTTTTSNISASKTQLAVAVGAQAAGHVGVHQSDSFVVGNEKSLKINAAASLSLSPSSLTNFTSTATSSAVVNAATPANPTFNKITDNMAELRQQDVFNRESSEEDQDDAFHRWLTSTEINANNNNKNNSGSFTDYNNNSSELESATPARRTDLSGLAGTQTINATTAAKTINDTNATRGTGGSGGVGFGRNNNNSKIDNVYFRSSYNDYSSEYNGSVVNIDILLTTADEQQQAQQQHKADLITQSSSNSQQAASSNSSTVVAINATTTLPITGVQTSSPERQCNVMGTLYKIGDVLPQDTGNCLQCVCIDGSTSDDTPRVTCSPHNCPPLVLPDLFDATGY
ncbi:probable serine/threonine-protein kinase yakA [Bactrocera oleae]|uniref:probable serine/threonine-protein kinase yakA n=1 Tax=Bactrocera oleae TaxID=104688 RepID=UPI00387EDEA0